MNPLARQFADLKFALQELESAVQQPREERSSAERILYNFPAVMTRLLQVLSEALVHAECNVESLDQIFVQAHARGWLKGEIGLWLHLAGEYEHLSEMDPHSHRALSLVQHIRACSSMLWQTYEMLTQRFRWQTQVVTVPTRPNSTPQNAAALLGTQASLPARNSIRRL